MSGGVKDLYHKLILLHNRHPVHFEKWEGAPNIIEAYNPICGDQFKLFIDTRDNRVQKATFHGYGCALSKAATSILIQLIEGKTLSQAQHICQQYMEAITQGKLNPGDPPEFGPFIAVKKFPVRQQCVTLSWKKLKEFLEAHEIN